MSLTLVTLAAAYLAVSIVLFARRKPGYRNITHTISELGEVGTADQRSVGFGVFLPVGVLLVGAAYFIPDTSASQQILALCIATGYIIAAFFPCDPGSPYVGSPRQSVHNFAG